MSDALYDVVIIGSGPAGIQAAIHASRKKAQVLMLGRIENSALSVAHVENYACISGVSDGRELLEKGLGQVQSFGTAIAQEDVLKITGPNPLFDIVLESGRSVRSRTVIFCMGVSKTKLNIPGEKEFSGRGVSYCVDCDANFYKGAVVAVTGNRSAAVDGALTLLDYASRVYLIAKDLEVSEDLRQKLEASEVEWITSSIEAVEGEQAVQSLRLTDGRDIETEGLFIELGSKGALQLATQIGVQLDTESFKYINTNKKQETNIAGVYAAGDIVGPPLQMAKAVGEGCVAGMEAATYAKKQKRAEAQ
ncbi:MAG: thioredoxin reductase [Desulfobulbus propionicus]|nr:MAG: thioredoxin reductase [Desulfobulbus propionicus]